MPPAPEYGTSLGLFNHSPDQLRQTIEREVRRSLNELAPGVDPGIILDILVDVNVQAHAQAQITLNMSVLHEVSYHAPLDVSAATTSATHGNWVNPETLNRRQEYLGTFAANAEDEVRSDRVRVEEHAGTFASDDRVDALRYNIGVDLARGPDRSVQHEYNQPGRPAPVRVPEYNISPPMLRLNDIQSRRFNLIDRYESRIPSLEELPWILRAVIQKKAPHRLACTCGSCLMRLAREAGPIERQEPPVQGRSIWQRIREDYALFE